MYDKLDKAVKALLAEALPSLFVGSGPEIPTVRRLTPTPEAV